MRRRVTLITLSVSGVGRARAFYGALGWKGEPPDDDVVFFQAGGMIVWLWGRDKLAADSAVSGGGWGGVTLAHNVASPGRGRRGTGRDPGRGRHDWQGRGGHVLGRLPRRVHRPRRPSLGGGPQPRMSAGGRRQRRAALKSTHRLGRPTAKRKPRIMSVQVSHAQPCLPILRLEITAGTRARVEAGGRSPA